MIVNRFIQRWIVGNVRKEYLVRYNESVRQINAKWDRYAEIQTDLKQAQAALWEHPPYRFPAPSERKELAQ